MRAGAPTGWALLGAVTLIGGGSIYSFVGVGESRPAWGVILLAVFAVGVFAEGAYKTWDNSERKRKEAERKAGRVGTREGLRDFLTETIEEARLIVREFDGLPVTNTARMVGIYQSMSDLGDRVQRQLRLHAPEFIDYWLTNRDNYIMDGPPMVDAQREAFRSNFLVWSEEQMLHIREHL